MPIYEYEPVDWDCAICTGKMELLQGIHEDAIKLCPVCGLEVRRLISRASIQISHQSDPAKAAERGFTTYKRAEKGVYEKIGGEGPDHIADRSGPAPKPTKKIDLDAQ